MKTTNKLFLLLMLLIMLAVPTTAFAAEPGYALQDRNNQPTDFYRLEAPQQSPDGDKLVLGGTFTLREDEVLEGSLFVMGGTATLREDSTVEGDVMLMGGTLVANGLIKGEVVVIGGMANLGETALVEGNVTTISGNMRRDEGAVIEGTVTENVESMIPFIFSEDFQIPNLEGPAPIIIPGDVHVPGVDVRINPVWDFLRVLFWSFIWALLAVLLVLFLPEPTGRTASVAVSQPLASGGIGCLTSIVAPLLIIILVITICGIPVGLVIAFLLALAWAFGMIALGLEVGRRLATLLKQDWALPVSAAVGTFILTLVVNTIGEVVPCVGWIVPAIAGFVGLGAVLLTRFGTQDYPPAGSTSLAPVPPAPPQPPVPGVMGQESAPPQDVVVVSEDELDISDSAPEDVRNEGETDVSEEE